GKTVPVIDIRPSTSAWAWTMTERITGSIGTPRLLAVPEPVIEDDAEVPAKYADLVEVDPTTLDPLPSHPTVGQALADLDEAKANLEDGVVPQSELPEHLAPEELNSTYVAVSAAPLSLRDYLPDDYEDGVTNVYTEVQQWLDDAYTQGRP